MIMIALLSFVLLELLILITLGRSFGATSVLSVILIAGAIGVILLRERGMRAVRAIQNDLNHQRTPNESLVGAGLFFLGCVLLILPGILSDLLGFVLIVPFTRKRLAHFFLKRLTRHIQAHASKYTDTTAVHLSENDQRLAAKRGERE